MHCSNDTTLQIYGQSDVKISVCNGHAIWTTNTLYVFDLYKKLFFVSNYDIRRGGISIKKYMYRFLIKDDSIIALCLLQNYLYILGNKILQEKKIKFNLVINQRKDS